MASLSFRAWRRFFIYLKRGKTMCGIVGYTGGQDSAPILLDGLKKLEYRGYDSAGIAVMDNSKITVSKAPLIVTP